MFLIFSNLAAKFQGDGGRGLSSLGWTGASQGTGLVLRLGSNLLLTRLLAPEAFALIGTALAFLTTLEWLSDLGIQPAIIRHERGDDKDVLSTGWWLGVFRGWGLSVIAVLAAWPMSMFYEKPELFGVLAVLALRPAMMSLRSPGMPSLRRQLNYRSIFIDELCMTVGGTLVSLLVAWYAPSVWAIVAGTVAGAVTGVAVSYVLCPQLPGPRSAEVTRDLWSFGVQIMINTLIMALWMNLDRLLGLKLLSDTEMGLYAVAWNLAAVSEALIYRCCDVHYSMLSRLADDASREDAHRKLMSKLARWIVPLFAGGICLAPLVIRTLYDDRYLGAQTIFLILMCRVLVRGIGQIEFQLLLSKKQIRVGTIAYVVALIVQAIAIVPLCNNFGASGMALSALLSTLAWTCTQCVLSNLKTNSSMTPVAASFAWVIVPLAVFPLISLMGL